MKRMMIGMALALFTLGAAHAQDKQQKTPEERAKNQTERMTTELGLNADQAAKVEVINLKYAQQADKLRAEHKADPTATKGKGSAMMDARMAELKGVLTPEQYAKHEKNVEAMKEKRKEEHKEKKAEGKH